MLLVLVRATPQILVDCGVLEVLRGIKCKFNKRKSACDLHRMFIDDRSWFCSELKAAVAIATTREKHGFIQVG